MKVLGGVDTSCKKGPRKNTRFKLSMPLLQMIYAIRFFGATFLSRKVAKKYKNAPAAKEIAINVSMANKFCY